MYVFVPVVSLREIVVAVVLIKPQRTTRIVLLVVVAEPSADDWSELADEPTLFDPTS